MALPRIGDALVAAGILTQVQIDEALELQKTTTEKIGPLLVRLGYASQELVDRCYGDFIIGPTVVRALVGLTNGVYATLANTRIKYAQLTRTSMVTDDLLHIISVAPTSSMVRIQGSAIVEIDESQSLPFSFNVDSATGVCEIEKLDAGGLRIWLSRMAPR